MADNVICNLNNLNFKIFKIPGNGNCLFGSILHQMQCSTASPTFQNLKDSDFRKSVIDFIEQNIEYFRYFLINEAHMVYDIITVTDDMLINKYILDLRKEGFWGGEVCIKAASMLTKRSIQVFQINHQVLNYEVENTEGIALRILFSTNHYDSIISINDEVSQDNGFIKSTEFQNLQNYATHISHDQEPVYRNKDLEKIRLATWNVRSASKGRKIDIIDQQLVDFNVDVAALQEVNVSAEQIISHNYCWYVSKSSRTNKSRGLAFAVRKGSGINVQQNNCVSKFVFSLKVEFNNKTLLLVNVHGPNKGILRFLAVLGDYVNINPYKKIMIVLGDFNSQIGRTDMESYEKKRFGNFVGHELCNENGELFKSFINNHSLNVRSTMFNKSTMWTRSGKNGNELSQIDFVLDHDDKVFKVVFLKAFEAMHKSDHKIIIFDVINSIREDLLRKKEKLSTNFQKTDLELFKYSSVVEHYKNILDKTAITINNLKNINQMFREFTKYIKNAAHECLKTSKAPISISKQKVINEIKTALEKQKRLPDHPLYKQNLMNKRLALKELIQNEEENVIIEFFQNLNEFSVGGRIRKTQKFFKKFKRNSNVVNNNNLNISMSDWDNDLQSLVGPEIELIEENENEILPDGPSFEEIKQILMASENGKAAGDDGIFIEYLKYADDKTIEMFRQLLAEVWSKNIFPNSWRKSIQFPLKKKSRPLTTNDFRKISLCNIGYKIYAKWVLSILKKYLNEPGIHQAAFTNDRSTDDNIFMVRRVMEENWNAGQKLYILSIDLEKAFDMVSLADLGEMLEGMEVPSKVINRVLQCMRGENLKILWNGQLSNSVNRGRGIKQGCPLSPHIFIYILQNVLQTVEDEVENLKLLSHGIFSLPLLLAFADDILLLSNNLDDLNNIMKSLKENLKLAGLNINFNKSEIMIRDPFENDANLPTILKIDTDEYKVVSSLKYLGVTLTNTLNRPLVTRQRCHNSVLASKTILKFLQKYKPSWELGKMMYKTIIEPSMTYGTKSTTLTKRNRLSVSRYEKNILREIKENCRLSGNCTKVKRLLNGKTVTKRIKAGRVRFFAHIMRRQNDHPLKLAYNYKLEKKKNWKTKYDMAK